jgi:hypothetical protein
MAFITMTEYATDPRVTAASVEYVSIYFGEYHRVAVTLGEAVRLANDLLTAVESMGSQQVVA